MRGTEHQDPSARPPARAASRPRPLWLRATLLVAGYLCLALAVVGIFLPLLPTTPLVLLAAFFFARGSETVHGWLLRHRVFGPMVREWEEHRRIPARAKWAAIALVLGAFTVSMFTVPEGTAGYVTLAVLGSALIIFLLKLPTSPRSANG